MYLHVGGCMHVCVGRFVCVHGCPWVAAGLAIHVGIYRDVHIYQGIMMCIYYVSVYGWVYVCMYVWVGLYACPWVVGGRPTAGLAVHVCIHTHTHTHTHTCTHVHVCTHPSTHTHTHTGTQYTCTLTHTHRGGSDEMFDWSTFLH